LGFKQGKTVPVENLDNEKEELAATARGDREAFRRLYSHYFPLVSQYVSLFAPTKECVDELVQDVFVRIWEKRERFAGVDSFQAYLFQMTRNQVFNYIRSIRLQRRQEEIGGQEAASAAGPDGVGANQRLIFSQYYEIAMEAIE
jgi:RNA polymerase sigma factor (sigma-70 family)